MKNLIDITQFKSPLKSPLYELQKEVIETLTKKYPQITHKELFWVYVALDDYRMLIKNTTTLTSTEHGHTFTTYT